MGLLLLSAMVLRKQKCAMNVRVPKVHKIKLRVRYFYHSIPNLCTVNATRSRHYSTSRMVPSSISLKAARLNNRSLLLTMGSTTVQCFFLKIYFIYLAGYSLVWYILKQLFPSVSVNSGRYLPRCSKTRYSPLITSTSGNNNYC